MSILLNSPEAPPRSRCRARLARRTVARPPEVAAARVQLLMRWSGCNEN